MTAEQNKVLVRRLVEEAVNPGNLDVLDEVAQGEFAVAARRWAGPFRDSFPDFRMEIAAWPPTARKWLRISGAPGPAWGNGWVTRRPAGASPMSMRSTSSACAAASWRPRSGSRTTWKGCASSASARERSPRGRTQNSHPGPGSAAVRPAAIAAPNEYLCGGRGSAPITQCDPACGPTRRRIAELEIMRRWRGAAVGSGNWVPCRWCGADRGWPRSSGGDRLAAGRVEGAQLCWRAACRHRLPVDRSRP